METFVSENPNPVLRIRGDGRVIYSNKAGELFLQEWGISVGEKVPSSIGNFSKRVISLNNPEKKEIKVGKRVYLVSFHPLEGEEQVNIYGFDVTDYRKLKEKLQIKEKQHDSLNQIGRMALRCESLQAFMDESVKLVSKALGVEYSIILELLGGHFLLRAGAGWKPGFVGKAIDNGSKGFQAGYTLYSKVPVIVRDFKKEKRLSASTFLKEHDVSSGISVVIGKTENPFGVLSAYSKKPRKFTADDTYFLNSVAFLISEVIERRRAEEELRQYKEKLEELVKERTSELIKTNERLIEEIAGRKQVEKALLAYAKELERSNQLKEDLERVVNTSPVIVFLWKYEPMWPAEFVSENITRLGYEVEDFTSNRILYGDIVHPEDLEKIIYELKMKVDAGCTDYTSEYRILTKSGEIRWVDERTVIQRNEEGEVHLQGIILDITEHKKAEDALFHMEEIRKKEIHHRIKNNLQVISSLLSLQAEHFSDKKVRESFQDSQNRVISMSLIHEELYKTGEIGDFETFDFKAYLQKLANELFRSYVVGNQNIHLKMDIERVFLGMDTGIPLGIIINELVSNSLKHAFPAGREGEIQIKLHKIENGKIKSEDRGTGRPKTSEFLLIVSDNGIGLLKKIDFRHTSSLGLQLVNILVDQIEGSIELVRGAGTEFRIKFRENDFHR